MKGFWSSKTTWLAIGTTLMHVGAIMVHGLPTGTSVMTIVISIGFAFLRDALKSHANIVSQVLSAAGVGVPLAAPADGGEAS